MPRKKSVSGEEAASSQPSKKFKADAGASDNTDSHVRRSLRNRTHDENVKTEDNKVESPSPDVSSRRRSATDVVKRTPPRRGGGFVVKTPSPTHPTSSCPLEVSIQVTPCDLTSRTDKSTETLKSTSARKRKTKTPPTSTEKKSKRDSPSEPNLKVAAEVSHPRVNLSKLKLEDESSAGEQRNLRHNDVKREAASSPEPIVKAVPHSPLIIREEDPLLNRLTVVSNQASNGQAVDCQQMSVVTYNMLSEVVRKKYDDYNYTPEKFLDLEYRHSRIIKELRYLDSDVVCLQEVDKSYFEDTLQPAMLRLGYVGLYLVKNGDVSEGEATFYRSSSFSLVSHDEIKYSELANQDIDNLEHSDSVKDTLRSHVSWPGVLLITTLKHRETDKCIVIGNTHLAWTKFTHLDISCMQMAYAFKCMVQNSLARHNELPFVLCGDFNSRIIDPAYQLAYEGYLNDTSLNILQSLNTVQLADGSCNSLVNLMWSAFQHPARHVVSSYATVLGKEPECTSRNFLMNHGVDYMWSSCVTIHSVTEVTKDPDRMPTELFPSDHLSLKTVYNL